VYRKLYRTIRTSCATFLLISSFLLLSGCTNSFSDFVNYGFSQEGIRAVFEFFGGSGIEAEIEPLSEQPVIILGNGIPESASIAIPDGPFILPVGNPFAIGSLPEQSFLSRILGMEISELSGILRYDIDADEDDNDAEQLLVEIITGQSPCLNQETAPGISGVELIDITPGSYTLAFADGNAADRLTLTGEGIRAILRNLDSPADATDEINALSLIDTATDSVLLGRTAVNPVHPAAGIRLEGPDEIHAFLEEVQSDEPAGISLIAVHEQSVSLYITNSETGTTDLFIFFNKDSPVGRKMKRLSSEAPAGNSREF